MVASREAWRKDPVGGEVKVDLFSALLFKNRVAAEGAGRLGVRRSR